MFLSSVAAVQGACQTSHISSALKMVLFLKESREDKSFPVEPNLWTSINQPAIAVQANSHLVIFVHYLDTFLCIYNSSLKLWLNVWCESPESDNDLYRPSLTSQTPLLQLPAGTPGTPPASTWGTRNSWGRWFSSKATARRGRSLRGESRKNEAQSRRLWAALAGLFKSGVEFWEGRGVTGDWVSPTWGWEQSAEACGNVTVKLGELGLKDVELQIPSVHRPVLSLVAHCKQTQRQRWVHLKVFHHRKAWEDPPGWLRGETRLVMERMEKSFSDKPTWENNVETTGWRPSLPHRSTSIMFSYLQKV